MSSDLKEKINAKNIKLKDKFKIALDGENYENVIYYLSEMKKT